MAMTSENRSPHDGFLADARIRPQDGPIDDGMFLDVALASDHAVGSDAGTGLDDGAFIDEARPLDDGAVLDFRLWRNPGAVMAVELTTWIRIVFENPAALIVKLPSPTF